MGDANQKQQLSNIHTPKLLNIKGNIYVHRNFEWDMMLSIVW